MPKYHILYTSKSPTPLPHRQALVYQDQVEANIESEAKEIFSERWPAMRILLTKKGTLGFTKSEFNRAKESLR